MLKNKSLLAIASVLIISACSHEVYLQPVPCVENNCPPCAETCPEIEMQTVTIQYQVYDVPSPKVEYTPCANSTTRKCRTVCRHTKIN